MKRKSIVMLLAASIAVTAMAPATVQAAKEGKVINIYSWNDEFRERVEAVYPEVKETSKDGTVTKLKDGTEIHWIVNPNQDGVYQQKLDEALMNQADASADDKVDIFLSETDYVNKYVDADADVAIPLTDLGIDPEKDLADQYDFTKINRHSPYLSITLHKCYPYYLFGISTFPNSAYHSIALRKFSITIV